MSCLYVLWDVIGAAFFKIAIGWCRALLSLVALRPSDDTIARKANASDATAFAKICGCFPSQGKPIIHLFDRARAER
jgi:hypothetical protein